MFDKFINKVIFERFATTKEEIDNMFFSDFEDLKDDLLEFTQKLKDSKNNSGTTVKASLI